MQQEDLHLNSKEPANLLYSLEATLTPIRTASCAQVGAVRRWQLPALPPYGGRPFQQLSCTVRDRTGRRAELIFGAPGVQGARSECGIAGAGSERAGVPDGLFSY